MVFKSKEYSLSVLRLIVSIEIAQILPRFLNLASLTQEIKHKDNQWEVGLHSRGENSFGQRQPSECRDLMCWICYFGEY